MNITEQDTVYSDFLKSNKKKMIIMGRLSKKGLTISDQGCILGQKSNECLALSLGQLLKTNEIPFPKSILSFILRESPKHRAEDIKIDNSIIAAEAITHAYNCITDLHDFVTVVISVQSNNVDIYSPELKGRIINDLPVFIIWHELFHYMPVLGRLITFGMFRRLISNSELRMCPIVFTEISTTRQMRVLDKLTRIKPLMTK